LLPPVILDSRRQKMNQFPAYASEKKVEGLILGSSRAFLLAPRELENLTGLRFYNFAVDGARAEDYLAIYRWARSRGAVFKKVIIAFDVEALHDANLFDDRLKGNGELTRALEGQGGSLAFDSVRRKLELAKNIFSKPYAQDIFFAIKSAAKGAKRKSIFDADGVNRYLDLDRQIAAGTFRLEERIEASQVEYRWRFEGMNGLSRERQDYLEALLKEAKGDGAKVVIYLTTLHPKLVETLSRETKYATLLRQTQDYLSRIGHEYEIPTFDFNDPSNFGGNLTDWYDGAHVSAPNAALIARKISGKNGI
jgi:hypothetical protein